jgi:hypothetical protein
MRMESLAKLTSLGEPPGEQRHVTQVHPSRLVHPRDFVVPPRDRLLGQFQQVARKPELTKMGQDDTARYRYLRGRP